MQKLLLTFDDADELPDIDKNLLFHNEKDAEEYLLGKGIVSVNIDISSNRFYFTVTAWKGTGKAIYVKLIENK